MTAELPAGFRAWATPPEVVPVVVDEVARALVERGLPSDAGLGALLAHERRAALGRVYARLDQLARGHTRGSWNQAASLVNRMLTRAR